MIRCSIKPGGRPDRGYWHARPLEVPPGKKAPFDIFVHVSAVAGGQLLEDGELVELEYEEQPGDRRRATFVRRLNGG